jgi:hypothetical protein
VAKKGERDRGRGNTYSSSKNEGDRKCERLGASLARITTSVRSHTKVDSGHETAIRIDPHPGNGSTRRLADHTKPVSFHAHFSAYISNES